jgi:hypothetical protein
MNRPTTALVRAFIEDAKTAVRKLQADGWPVEVVIVDEPKFIGVRLEVPLDGLRLPTASVNAPYAYDGPPLESADFG